MLKNIVLESNWFQKSVRRIVNFFEKWWAVYIVNPLLLGLAPSIITMLSINKTVQESAKNFLSASLITFMSDHVVLVVLSCGVSVVIIRAIFALLKILSKEQTILDLSRMFTISGTFDEIVKSKYSRFSNEAKRISSKKRTSGEIFSSITQPEQQIYLLTTGIKTVFESLYEMDNLEIKASIMSIKNSKPVECVTFRSRTDIPKTIATQLDNPNSTIKLAATKKQMIIVSDIQKEIKIKNQRKKRYIYIHRNEIDQNSSPAPESAKEQFDLVNKIKNFLFTQKIENLATLDTDATRQGSLICYPITCKITNTVEYVITISCNKKDCFKDTHKPLYEWLFPMFCHRILVEHALLKLKEKADE
jgi:hypothetical protein